MSQVTIYMDEDAIKRAKACAAAAAPDAEFVRRHTAKMAAFRAVPLLQKIIQRRAGSSAGVGHCRPASGSNRT